MFSHRCLVSFTVDQDALSLSEVKEHLLERNSSLEALGYPILTVSQGKKYMIVSTFTVYITNHIIMYVCM